MYAIRSYYALGDLTQLVTAADRQAPRQVTLALGDVAQGLDDAIRIMFDRGGDEPADRQTQHSYNFV